MEREKFRDRTLDWLHAWAGIGVFARLAFAVAIIAACVWLGIQVFALAAWINSLLTGRIEP